MTVVPESKELKTLHLHSRQCSMSSKPCRSTFELIVAPPADIHSVMVGTHPAEFVHHDSLSSLHTSKSDDCHTHPELKRKFYSALAEGDEGELSIGIPKEIVIRPSGHAMSGIASEGMVYYLYP